MKYPTGADATERLAHDVLHKAWLLRQVEDVMPVWFILERDGGINIVGTPYDEEVPNVKERSALAVADIVRRSAADAVVFVSDVWMRTVPAGAADRHEPPSQMPDSVEAIVVLCWRRTGDDLSLYRRYRQRDDGSLEALGGDEIVRMTSYEANTYQPVVDALRAKR